MNDLNKFKTIVDKFPLFPGVYQMKDKHGNFLYVGKAKALKKRVQSYLRIQNSGRVQVLMSHVHNIEYIVTENEYEALLLEHNLIKEHHPKYNILLQDDKTFPMLKITKEEYPRVIKTRKIINDGAEYFGPYLFMINQYLEFIEKNFSLRRCKKIKPRKTPCLYYHIGRCTAVCARLTTKEAYLSRVKKIRSLLQGKTKMLKKDLTIQMHKHAKAMEYEQAVQYRNSLAALEAIETEQHINDNSKGTRHYIGTYTHDNKCCIIVVHLKNGKMVNQHTTFINMFDSLDEALEQFFLSYYHKERSYPHSIITQFKTSPEIKAFFSTHDTVVQTPDTPNDEAIIRFAKENARYGLNRHIQEYGNQDAVELLQSTLSLKSLPMRIEGFDIATIQGIYTTAAMVVFINGVSAKSEYRHFNIKSLESGQMNDFQSIQEAMSRRYSRLKNEGLPMPDLILIDGGIGQVNSAQQILDALELHIPILGLAKKEEEIYFPSHINTRVYTTTPSKNPLKIPLDDPASKLLQAVRNEAHRFATTFREHKQLKAIQYSSFTEIKGIGEAKAKKIITLYPTFQKIIDVPIDELCSTLGVSKEVGQKIQEKAGLLM